MDPIERPAAWLVRDLPGCTGRLYAQSTDFRVEETLAYQAEGQGDHIFVHIEKQGIDTRAAARQLAAAVGVPAKEIGWAGLKDRHSETTQWLSLPWKQIDALPAFDDLGPEMKVVEAIRHPKKLKAGHVRSNRFTVTLRDVEEGGLERAQAIASRLTQEGLPFSYGPQRQGRFGDNHIRAKAILRNEQRAPRDRKLLRLFMSALQARGFSEVLGKRLQDGTWNTPLDGDLAVKHDERGGMFEVTDPVAEAGRMERIEISPSGPLFGKKMRPALRAAAELENEAWVNMGLTDEQKARLGSGTRRTLRIPMGEIEIEAPTQDTLRIAFDLPSGGYATVVLDALVQPEEGHFDRTHPPKEDRPES